MTTGNNHSDNLGFRRVRLFFLPLIVLGFFCCCSTPNTNTDDEGESPIPQNEQVEHEWIFPDGPSYPCDAYRPSQPFGRLPSEVDEASGIVVSGYESHVFWLHNDSGDGPHLYAVNANGTLLATIILDGVSAHDWEDMARGPCNPTDAGSGCLYIADIGDNDRDAPSVSIYRIAEPLPTGGDQSISDVETMTVAYPDEPHNAEAMVVDSNGRVYIITKERGAFSIYSAPYEPQAQVVVLEFHGRHAISTSLLSNFHLVTAADLGPDDARLLLRTYGTVYEFRRERGAEFPTIEDWEQVTVPVAPENQGEAIAYGADGYWHVSEGSRAPLFFVRCEPE